MRFLAATDELELLPSELEIAEWQLFDLPGRLLKSHKPERDFASYPQRISLSGLEAGAYFLRVKDGSGQLRLLSFRRF